LRRIVLLGSRGVFGSAIAAALRERGFEPHTPSHAQVDVEKVETLLSSLHPRDVVIDAAGPFHQRTTTLIEVAIKVGFDVIDLSDNLGYALAVQASDDRLQAAGICVFTSCSAVSAVTAAAVRKSGIQAPIGVSVCLLPASRDTSSSGTTASLLRSLSRPIRVLRDGRLTEASGWSSSKVFRLPGGRGERRGYLAESADAVTLPWVWSSLRGVDFWVDTQVLAMNRLIATAVLLPVGRRLLEGLAPIGLPLARLIGSHAGGYIVEVVANDGRVSTTALVAQRRSYLTAVLPATLAAKKLAGGDSPQPGVVPPDRLCDPDELFAELRKLGIEIHQD
jgi:saccharopine dehydrogenase-like NADP-dependent oxidoreductase